MDAFGVRPVLREMAARLASHGYHVLLPDLYYRLGKFIQFNPPTAFKDQAERAKLMPLFQSLTNPRVMDDTAAFVGFLQSQSNVDSTRLGCVGYCMGGPFALSAAGAFPNNVAAAASFHGGRLATDKPDSPHLLAPKMKGAIYVGIAGIDPNFTPEEKQRLESALAAANVKHTVEVYTDVKHGFAIADHPAYDKHAAERHWEKLLELFAGSLQPA
jgi:carboxymethylenebutenolidase